MYGDTAKALNDYAVELKKTFDPVWEEHIKREEEWSSTMPADAAKRNMVARDPDNDLDDLEPSMEAVAREEQETESIHKGRVTVKTEVKA